MINISQIKLTTTEIEAINKTLRSGQLVQGEVTEKLESEFAKYHRAQHAIAVNSGTAALHCALYALGIKAGDEVEVIENESSLLINGFEKNKDKSCRIDITDFTIPLLWRYFQGAYRSGCTEIKLVFDSGKKEYEDAYHYYTTQFDYSRLGEKIPPKPAIAVPSRTNTREKPNT